MIETSGSESLFKVLIDYAPFAIAIFDTDMHYLATSRRWMNDYALGERDIIGLSHYAVFPDLPEIWKRVHRQALQGTKHQEGEDPFARANGTVQWIRWVVEPWHQSSAEIGGIVIFTEDITDRKVEEKALHKSAAYLRALFQSASDYVLLLDIQASGPPVIVDANDAAFAKFGYSREEMIGQRITRFETEASAKMFAERSDQVRQDGMTHFEVEHLCKDGSTFFARVSAKMVAGMDGDPKVLVAEQDITAIKQAEERQHMLLEENRQLTHNLMQVQEEERRVLARSLHDNLGQILTSINTSAFYIAKHASNVAIRETAQQISANAQLIFDANHEILLKLRPSALDALGLEAALVELVAYWRKHSGIECTLHTDGEIDHLTEAHAIAIYRLVQEGMTNAIRHGKARHVEVILHILPERSGASAIQLKIKDDGVGKQSEAPSTGLGIIGMRERVRALGGVFIFDTSPSGGVCIEATIPLPKREEGHITSSEDP